MGRRRRDEDKMDVTVTPTGGVDYSAAPSEIADNALSRAYNVWFDPRTSKLTTRMGLSLDAIAALTNPILALKHYIPQSGSSLLICASGGKLKKHDGAAWADIATLNSSSIVPSMLTFNGHLLAADGGTGITKWDGTTATIIAGSPANPTALHEHANRVISNSSSDLDAVYFSGPEDSADWDVNTGAAVSVRCGYGDGYRVVGFASLYDYLIVTKVAYDTAGDVAGRKLYAINTSGTPTTWSSKLVSSEIASLWHDALAAVGERVYAMDSTGFKAFSPSEAGAYGDIANHPTIGRQVNPQLSQVIRSAGHCQMRFLPSLSQLWVVPTSSDRRVWVYHPLINEWTEIEFIGEQIRCVCEVGGTVYLASTSGKLWTLTSRGSDELTDGVETPLVSAVRTKLFEAGDNDLLLRFTKLSAEFLLSGDVKVECYGSDLLDRYTLGTFSAPTSGGGVELYSATTPLSDANTPLSDDSASRGQSEFWGGPRSSGICWQVRTTGARISINSIKATIKVI